MGKRKLLRRLLVRNRPAGRGQQHAQSAMISVLSVQPHGRVVLHQLRACYSRSFLAKRAWSGEIFMFPMANPVP